MQSFALPVLLASLISFVILFLIGYALMRFVGNLLETALNATGLRSVNGLLGFLWGGVLEVGIVCALVIYVLELQTVFDLSAVFDKSQFTLNVVRPLVPETVNWFASTVQAPLMFEALKEYQKEVAEQLQDQISSGTLSQVNLFGGGAVIALE